jgi:DNA repair exonuclease SbcCD ATPase subunit
MAQQRTLRPLSALQDQDDRMLRERYFGREHQLQQQEEKRQQQQQEQHADVLGLLQELHGRLVTLHGSLSCYLAAGSAQQQDALSVQELARQLSSTQRRLGAMKQQMETVAEVGATCWVCMPAYHMCFSKQGRS